MLLCCFSASTILIHYLIPFSYISCLGLGLGLKVFMPCLGLGFACIGLGLEGLGLDYNTVSGKDFPQMQSLNILYAYEMTKKVFENLTKLSISVSVDKWVNH